MRPCLPLLGQGVRNLHRAQQIRIITTTDPTPSTCDCIPNYNRTQLRILRYHHYPTLCATSPKSPCPFSLCQQQQSWIDLPHHSPHSIVVLPSTTRSRATCMAERRVYEPKMLKWVKKVIQNCQVHCCSSRFEPNTPRLPLPLVYTSVLYINPIWFQRTRPMWTYRMGILKLLSCGGDNTPTQHIPLHVAAAIPRCG